MIYKWLPSEKKQFRSARFFLFLFGVFFSALGFAQTSYTWQGGGTTASPGAWGTAANWNPSGVPGGNAGDQVTITSGCVAYSSGSTTIAKITVGNTASTQGILNITGGTLTVSGAGPVSINGGIINNSAGTLNVTATSGNGISFSNPTSTTAANTAGTGYFGAGALAFSISGASNFAVNFTNTSWTSPTVVPTMTFNNPTISALGATGYLVNVAASASSGGMTNGIIAGSGATLPSGTYGLINQLGAGATAGALGSNLTINAGCTLSSTGTASSTYAVNINNNSTGNTAANATLTNNGTINISGVYTIGVRLVSSTGSGTGVTKFDNFGTVSVNLASTSGASCLSVNAATGAYAIVNETGANMTLITQKASTAPITFSTPTAGSSGLTFTNAGTLTAIGTASITMNSIYNAINNTGGTFAVNYAVAGSPSVSGNAIQVGVPYTWTGATSLDYAVATNWSPNRNTVNIVNSDILKFTSSPAGTIANVSTQTIGGLQLSGNASVSLQPATGGTTKTLTVGDANARAVNNTNAISDLNVPSGCTLALASNSDALTANLLSLGLASGVTNVVANIAGTLTINTNTGTTFGNIYNAQNGVTTVTGTVNNAGGFGSSSATSLVFSNGSTYNHTRTDNLTFPVAGYTGVNVGLGSTSGSTDLSITNFPPSIGTLTVNPSSGFSAKMTVTSLSPTGSTLSINNLQVQFGNSSAQFQFGNFGTSPMAINIGSGGINVSAGRLNFATGGTAITQNITSTTGDMTLSGTGYVTLFNYGGAASTCNLTVNNYSQSGASSQFYLNTVSGATATLTVTGNFSKTAGTFLNQNGSGTLVMNGSAAQTFGCDVFGASTPTVFEIKNTASSPNNTVTLGAPLTVNGTLKLTSGILVASASNAVTLSSSGTTGASSTSYITGNVKYPSASTAAFTLPVGYGTDGSNYAPITITPAAATSVTFNAAYASSNSIATFNSPLTSYYNSGLYSVSLSTGTIGASVQFPYSFSTPVNSTADLVVAAGTSSLSRVSASPVVSGNTTSGTISDATAISFSTTATSVVVGSVNASSNLFTTLTYTWTGSTSSDFQVASNWSPARSSNITTDILQFTSSPSATVTNVPTQTIGRLVISGSGTSVTLQSAANNTVLTVGGINGTGDEISVAATCSLSLASLSTDAFTLALASTSGVTANIAGTLNINANASGTFTNIYNAQNGVTTIGGTVNNAGTFSNATSTSLVFGSGSTYNHTRTDNGTFPAASYTSVNVGLSSTLGSSTVAVTNFPASIGTLTINTPGGFTGSLSINGLSTGSTLAISNFTVQSGTISFSSAVTQINIGSGGINVSGGRINFGAGASAYTSTINCTGDFNLSSTGVVTLFNFSSAASTCSLTVNNFVQTGASSQFYLNSSSNTSSSGTLTVTGNFSKTGGGTFTQPTAGISGTLVMNGASAQTFSCDNFGTGTPSVLEIKNTATSPNNTVTLGAALTLKGSLKLTSGNLVTGSNSVTLSSSGFTGGSATSFVSGTAKYASSSTAAFTLPLGSGTTYAPITITPAATAATFTVTYGSAAIGTVSSPLTSYANGGVYTLTTSVATTATVSMPYTFSSGVVNATSDLVIATATPSAFSQLSASPSLSGSPTVTSGTISDPTSISLSTSTTNVAVGSVNSAGLLYSYATYVWTGSVSTDYQVAGNWSPARSSTATSDVLSFTGSATVTNVPSQTISQLLLSGGSTVVGLQSAAGGSTLTVGNYNFTGNEISVPSGCTLSLNSLTTDVFTLALANTTGITASVAGTLNVNANASGTFTNVYNAQNGVTTVTGTVNNAGSFGTSSTSSLVFNSGSNYNHTRTDNGTFPAASYTSVNVGMSSTTGASTVTVTNFPASIGTLTINEPVGFTGSLSINSLSTGSTLAITNFTVQSGTVSFSSAVTQINIGSGGINVSGGRVNFGAGASAYTSTINCTGNLSLSGSGYITMFNFSAAASTCSLTVNNFTQSGSSSNFYLNSSSNTGSAATMTVLGNFSKTAGTFTQATAGTGGTLVMNGSAAQTFSCNAFGTGYPTILEINNTATSPNNTVTLGAALTLGGTLKLTSGLLVLGSNNLTLSSTASLSPTTPTNASYVNTNSTGKMIRNSVPSSGSTVFPVGTSTSYAPLVFTGGTAGANITVGVSGSFTNAVNVSANVVNLQWSILASASTQPQVTFQYNSADAGSGYTATGAILGTYSGGSYLESTLGSVSGSNPFTATKTFGSDLPTSTAGLYGIGSPNAFISGVPGAPTGVSAVAGNASAVVSFSAPASTGSSAITSYTVTSTPGNITATGSSSPITVNGLTAGTAYTFVVLATNGSGNSGNSTASASITPTGTYTWTGSTSNNYQTSTNWSPNRATASQFDVLQFTGNATVVNVPTETISRLVLSGTASVSLQPVSGTSTTLSVGKTHVNGVDEISVPSGCTLTLAGNASGGTEFITLRLANGVSGTTALFAGTLTISPNATGTFLNTYNAASGVTTISGTVNNAGSFSSATTTSLVFNSGSTYNHTRTDNGTFPVASYTSVNVGLSSTVGSSTVTVTNFPTSIGTLTINETGFTGALSVNSLSNGGPSLSINNFTVQSGTISFTSAVTTCNIGSGGINISGGRINFASGSSAYTSSILCTGDLNLSGTGYITLFNFSAAASTCTLTVNNFTQTGSGSIFYLNSSSNTSSSATLNVLGNFSKTAGSFTQATAGTSGTLVMNGSAAQTFSCNAFGTGYPSTFEIKNTASSPNNTVTLNAALTVGALKMTSGLMVLGNFSLTANSTSGGSSTAYVNASGTGKLIVKSVGNTATLFPVGTASSYAPLTITNTTGTSDLSLSVKPTFTNAPIDATKVVNLEWSVLGSSATTATIIFQYNSGDKASGYTVGSNELGTFTNGTAYAISSITTSGSSVITGTKTGISIPSSGNNFFVIGNSGAVESPFTTWTSTSNTTWTNAANWNNGVPTTGVDPIIAATSASPVFTGTQTVGKLTINSGATLINNGTLNVTSNFGNNGVVSGTGTLVLNGSSTQAYSGTGTIANLTLDNSNGLSITSGNKLNISGLLTLKTGTLTTNGNVVFKSTGLATTALLAPVGVSPNTGTISGTVMVERFIPSGYRAYRDFAPVVANAGSVFSNWQENGSSTSGKGIFVTGATADSTTDGVDASNGIDKSKNGLKSMWTFGTSWTAVTNTKTTSLSPFKGYRVMVRGDRSFSLFTTPVHQSAPGVYLMMNATALRATGNLVTGNVTYNTSGVTAGSNSTASVQLNGNTDSAYSLIGNPYLSPLDWKNVWDNGRATNLDANYWYLDPTIGTAGAYVAYNAASNTASNGVAAARYIQPGQAFFVQNTTTSPQLALTESDKSVANIGNAVFGSGQTSRIGVKLFKDVNGSNTLMDQATLVFGDAFQNAVAKEDAKKLNNPSHNLAIWEQGALLAIDARKPASEGERIPLALDQLSQGAYRLEIAMDAYQGKTPYLVNTATGVEQQLVIDNNSVAFVVDKDNASVKSYALMFRSAQPSIASGSEAEGDDMRIVAMKNKLQLVSSQSKSNVQVVVFNNEGKAVKTAVLNGNRLTMDLPIAGAYHVHVIQVGQKDKVLKAFVD